MRRPNPKSRTVDDVVTAGKTKKKAAPKKVGRAARRNANAKFAFDQYLVPGAVALGGGLLTATGVVLRKELREFAEGAFDTVVSRAMGAMKTLDARKLMMQLGLKRRRSLMSFAGPGLGMIAGILAGSALTLWLAPKLLPHQEDEGSPERVVGSGLSEQPRHNSTQPTISTPS